MNESKKDDGGPAFPDDGQANYTGGMTLRDYAALTMMGNMLPLYTQTKVDADGCVLSSIIDVQGLACAALRVADAYLKERAK